MIEIPNTIQNINSNYRVLSTKLSTEDLTPQSRQDSLLTDNNFIIELELEILKSNKLINKARYIEVNVASRSSSSFISMFNNSILEKKSESDKKYSTNEEFENIFQDDIRKSTFLDYNSSFFNKSVLYTRIFDFDLNDFTTEINYTLKFDNIFSRRIFNYAYVNDLYLYGDAERERNNYFDKIRISILDENYNILDITQFKRIDFSLRNMVLQAESITSREFYEPMIQEFENNLTLEPTLSPNKSIYTGINSSLRNQNLEHRFTLFFINSSSFLDWPSIRTDYYPIGENSLIDSRVTRGGENSLTRFFESILESYDSNIEEFVFNIACNIREINSTSAIDVVNKRIVFDKNDAIFEEITNFNGRFSMIYGSRRLRSIEISVSLENNLQKTGIIISSSSNFSPNSRLSDIIRIEDISINNESLEFFYNDPRQNIENKILYKGMTYREFFIENNYTIWRSTSRFLNNRDVRVTINFVYDNAINQLKSAQASLSEEYFSFDQNIPNNFNRLIAENLYCSDTNINLFLNESDKSMFLYESFTLNNIEYFRDIANSYGYENIQEFFRNCKVKIFKNLSLNGEEHSDVSFMGSFNDMFNIDTSNLYSTNFTFISSNFFLDNIYDLFSENEVFNNETNIFSFLSNTSKNEKINILNNITNFNISSNLQFYFLPIPKVIYENIGAGFDDNDNVNVEPPENTTLFQRTLLNYLSSSASNNSRDSLTRVMFNDGNRFSSFLLDAIFDYFLNSDIVSTNSFYNKNLTYNKQQIIDLLNSQTNIEENEFETEVIRRSIINRLVPITRENYYNLNFSENAISYSNMPFQLEIIKENAFFDKSNECVLPRELSFIRNANNVIRLNTRYINDVFSTFPLEISIDEASKDRNISNLFTKFSFHFILSFDDTRINTDSESITLPSNRNYLPRRPPRSRSPRNVANTNTRNNIVLPDNISRAIINNKDCIYNERSELEFSIGSINRVDIDFSMFRDFFEFAKNNNFNYLESFVIRTHLNFNIDDNVVDTVFTTKLPILNYDNKLKYKINNINAISTRLF